MTTTRPQLDTELPYIPPQVKPDKLFPGLTEAVIAKIEKELANPSDPKVINYIQTRLNGDKYGRYSKEIFGLNFGFLYGQHGLYAIYNEEGTQKEIIEPGAFGKIKLAKNVRTPEWCVLKTFLLENPTISEETRLMIFENEQAMLAALKLCNEPPTRRRSNKNDKLLKGYILMKYIKGIELFEHMRRKVNKDNPEHYWPDLLWLHVSIRLIEKYLSTFEQQGILHGDIKFENILFDVANDEVHFIDLGSAKRKINDSYMTIWFPPIIAFRAPEVTTGVYYTNKSEIYALAGILEGLLCNRIYYRTENQQNRAEIRPIYRPCGTPTIFSHDDLINAFLTKMHAYYQSDRPTLQETLAFLKETYNRYAEDPLYSHDILRIQKIIQDAATEETLRLQKANQIANKNFSLRFFESSPKTETNPTSQPILQPLCLPCQL